MADREMAAEPKAMRRASELLGGVRVLGRPLERPLDVHDLLSRGLPARSLAHLLGRLLVLDRSTVLETIVGMNPREIRRRTNAPATPLTIGQSGRLWKFAEILAWASDLFGAQEEAEWWLDRPAMVLNQRRPIELLATPAGTQAVEEALGRLEHGVYA